MRFNSILGRCRRVARGGAIVASALAILPTHGRAQNATLLGRVLRDSSEVPLTGAEIQIVSLGLRTRSDSLGRFRIQGIAQGTHEIEVRLIGFQPSKARVQFGSALVEADFVLVPLATQLQQVEIVDASSADARRFAIKLTEFEERRSSGIGRYLTADQFARENGRPTSSIIASRIAGFRIMRAQGRSWLASGRDQSSRNAPSKSDGISVPQGCYVQVIVNGRIEYGGQSGQSLFDVDALNSLDIIGMEFYSVANTPSRFKNSGASQCGTVIIWTKGG